MNVLGWMAIIILTIMNVILMSRIAIVHKNQKEIVEILKLSFESMSLLTVEVERLKRGKNGTEKK